MKNANFFTFVLAFLIVIGFPLSAVAGTVSGKFEFKRRPARGAIVFMPEDHGLVGKPKIDQMNKRFTNIIFVGKPGSQVDFHNSDSVNHNIFASDKEKGVNFDIGLAPPGSVIKQSITWKQDTFIKIGCKIHPRMRSYIGAVDSKYYAVMKFAKKQKEGTFAISGVPDALRKIRVWLPGYEPVDIELGKGASKKAELIRRGKVRGTVTIERN